MSLMRWVTTPDGAHRSTAGLGFDYRVRDRAAWQAWLERVAGAGSPELEVVKRTLRVKDPGPELPVVRDASPQPAAPAPRPLPAPPSAAAPAPADDVKQRVLAIIAATTGYPPDMLDDTLDLEADLGVDTVKQAETFAAVRAAYDIPVSYTHLTLPTSDLV